MDGTEKKLVFDTYFVKENSNILIIIIIASLIAVISIVSCFILKKKINRKRLNLILMIALILIVFPSATSCVNNVDDGLVPQGYNVYSYDKIDGKLDNPGMGWVLSEEPIYGGHVDIGSSGNFPEVDNITLSTSWAAIEYEEGKYDFSVLDNTIAYWTKLGKRINLRICTDNLVLPYTYKGVPDWLFEKYNNS
jgi:hypothetical protein